MKESITLSYQPPSIKLWAVFSRIKSKLQGVQMIPGSQNDIYMLLLMHQILYPVTHLHRNNFIAGGYQTNYLMQPYIKIILGVIFHWTVLSLFSDLTKTVSLLKLPDFEILAFPCNQFLRQEPGTAEQAKDFACTRFKAEYPVFQKVRTVFWTCLLVQKLLLSFLISRWCHGVYMSHGRVHQFGN